jgi:Tfp pilus assembly major pilin PilA
MLMLRLLTITLLSVFLLSCGQAPEDEPGVVRSYQRPSIADPDHVAWLSRRLPDSTVAYLRIPNPWQALLVANGNVLSQAQENVAHRKLVDQMAAGLSAQLQAALPGISALPRYLIIEQQLPVLEVAALAPIDGSLVPDAMIGTTLPARNTDEFNDWLRTLANDQDAIQIQSPADDQGFATLMAGPLPLYLHFDGNNGKLLGLTGFGSSQQRIRDYAAGIDQPLTALPNLEARLDATGRGWAVWADPLRLWPLIKPTLDPLDADLVDLSGLPQASSLWLGTSARGGRAEWRLQLVMPEVGFRRYLTRVDVQSALATAGEPQFAARMALPDANEFQQMIDLTLAETIDGTAVREELTKLRSEFQQALGFQFDDLVDALGPDLVLVGDEAGYWAALHIRDREALARVISGLESSTGTSASSRTVAGLSINHWALPGIMSLAAEAEDVQQDPALAYLSRLRNHLFWVEQDDYLITASTPQVLIDRAASDHSLMLTDWLSRGMGLDWSGTILGAVTAEENLPRNVYYLYLQGLMMLADLVEVDIDPLELPSAQSLDLPDIGRYGARIDSTSEVVNVVLSFEFLPLDALATGNALTTTFATGVLAAIAIPAYQDYTLRARVSEALNSVAGAKLMISEYLLTHGQMPVDLEQAGATDMRFSDYLGAVAVSEQGLLLTFANIGPGVDGLNLHLGADLDQENGLVNWHCLAEGTTADPRHLPGSCRELIE